MANLESKSLKRFEAMEIYSDIMMEHGHGS